MAYGDNTLGASHQWTFNNVLADNIGNLNIISSGSTFSATPITRNSAFSLFTNNRVDISSVPTTTDTGSTGLSRYAFGGWFRVNQIQGPPTLIYKQGGNISGFALFLWAGNNVLLQVKDSNSVLLVQIFSNIALTSNRNYHFFVKYSSASFDNKIEFFIDGVKQTSNKDGDFALNNNMSPHDLSHTWGNNGIDSIEVQVGTESVIVRAPIEGFLSQWWTWFDANADLSELEIKNNIFGEGAIPEIVITSDTQENMQLQLDGFSNTNLSDFPLSILIEEVLGDGDLTLESNNIVSNERASVDVKYEGTGKLSFINKGTSNLKNGTSIYQKIDFIIIAILNVTVLDASSLTPITGARVFLTEDTNDTVVLNELTDNLGSAASSFNYLENINISGRVRKADVSPFYKSNPVSGIITELGLNLTILLIKDE